MSLAIHPFVPPIAGSEEESREELLRGILESRAFDYANQPQKPWPILSLGEKVISTPGNITNIQAAPKAGKTAVISGIIGAFCGVRLPGSDTLGFVAANPDRKAVLHIDTEQSRYDADTVVRQGLTRAGLDAPPSNFESYWLTDLPYHQRAAALYHVIRAAAERHGGIQIIIIDGVSDICADPNNSEESFTLIDKLHATAIQYNCVVLTVLHENPGSGDGKTRGHLGSQLERKAETNLRLAKDSSGVTTVWCERGRHCHIPRKEGFRFSWSLGLGMHVSAPTQDQTNGDIKNLKLQEELTKCFQNQKTLQYADFVQVIMNVLHLKESAAKKRVSAYAKAGLVRKLDSGKYMLQPIQGRTPPPTEDKQNT